MSIEIALLPGEGVIGARGACDAGALYKIKAGGVAVHGVKQEALGDGARLAGGQVGTRGGFGDLVLEACQFARGRHVYAELFLLQGAEPAPGPAPQAHAAAHEAVGPIETQLTLEESLG